MSIKWAVTAFNDLITVISSATRRYSCDFCPGVTITLIDPRPASGLGHWPQTGGMHLGSTMTYEENNLLA